MQRRRYRNLGTFFRRLFGQRVHKVGLWGGFDCPNRDGTLCELGCSFCNPESSRPASLVEGMTIDQQLERGINFVSRRFGASAFLPYLQDYSATYGELHALQRIYRSVLERPEVVGLALCTRPDCLQEPVLDLLGSLSTDHFIWVEVGVQTFNDEILKDMNRCHGGDDSIRALKKLSDRGIPSAAHMILGYPGQTVEDAASDARLLSETGTEGVKLHNLHVVRGTAMEKRYREGTLKLQSMEEYVETVLVFLRNLSSRTVVLRLRGDASGELAVAPNWSLSKGKVLRRIEEELEERKIWQGISMGCSLSDLDTLPAWARELKRG